TFEIRPLPRSARQASARLRAEAFGGPTPLPSALEREWPPPGHSPWGTYDGDTLAARAFRRAETTWFGGVEIPTNGLSGVVVAPEYRGLGLLEPLIGQVLEDGRAAGDAI